MILKAYSKGLYANWFYYAPDRVLFDCGEGVALHMRNGLFAIERIFISHSHMDHIAGLPALIALHQSTKGDNDKPLTIHYPARDRNFAIFRNALEAMTRAFVRFPLHWAPLEDGQRVELRKGRRIEAFPARHPADHPLAFRILESRKRLKPELRGTPGRELAKLPETEKVERYEACIVCYSGDSMPLPTAAVRNCELLIHDCTFLRHADRGGPTHATVQEVFDLAAAAAVRHLVLAHISPRYESNRRIRALIEAADSHGISFNWIPHNRVYELP